MVKLLVIANPHVIDNPEIMDALENRLPSMPQSYIDDIINQPEVSSQYKVLEGNVAADYHQITSIGEDIKRMYRNNSEDAWAKDSLIAFVSRQPGMYDKFELASIYLTYGQYDELTTLLNNIPNEFEMDNEKTAEFTEFSTIINIAKNIYQNNLFESGLTETQRSTLESVLEEPTPNTAPLALSLLKRDNPEYVYEEVIFDLQENLYSMAQPSNQEVIEDVVNTKFKTFPNPSLDYTTLSYDCKFAQMSFSIVDIQGRILMHKPLKTIEDKDVNEVLIDLSSLSTGTYQILVNTNAKTIWSEKLIISK